MLFKRIGLALLMIWMTLTTTFFLIRVMPGNPMTLKLHTFLQQGVPYPMAVKRVQLLFGINAHEPLWRQYLGYLAQSLRGNLGISIQYPGTSVLSLIGKALPWTVFTVGVSLLLSFLIGVALGTVGAYRRNGIVDRLLTPISALMNGIPNYLTGTILLFIFTVLLTWFPQQGAYGLNVNVGLNLAFIDSVLVHAILPIGAYVISQVGGWYLLMKSNTISTLGQDFIAGARSFGIPSRRIMGSYVAPNAILPLFTNLVLSLGFMFGGSVFVETIFTYPGIGYLFGSAMSNRDYPLMEGLFALMTIAVIISNLIADLFYLKLDPRITLEDLN